MSSLRSALTLATGLAVGGVSGWVVRGLGDSHAPVESVASPREDEARTRIAALERDVEAERAARGRAEASRDAALARALEKPAAAAPVAREASGESAAASVASGAPARTAGAASRSEKPASDGAGRAAQLEVDVARALEAKDGKAALALLNELAKLGKAGWPLAAKVAGALGEALEEGRRFEAWNVGRREFLKGVQQGDFPDLMIDAIQNPQDAYPAAFRRLAAARLPWTDREGTDALLLGQLGKEADESVAESLLSGLSAQSNADRIHGLLAAWQAQSTPAVRNLVVQAIEETPGDEATRALAAVVSQESDPEVKKAADLALGGRQAQVAGLFVTEIVDGSQAAAAGVQLGDILTEVNGIPIRTWDDIGRGKARVAPGAPSTVLLYRSGASMTLALKGGQIGVNGRVVAPASR